MSAFLEHSHLLDGVLGRGGAYVALALLLGVWLWELHWQRPLKHNLYYRIVAVASGFSGMAILLGNIALESTDPFNTNNMALPALSDIAQVLHTSFGMIWTGFGIFLLISAISSQPYIRLMGLMVMLFALAWNSHAGENGIGQWIFWVDWLHLSCALLWFGGLSLLVVFRLTRAETTGWRDLQFFSRLALPVFMLALASGVIRALLQYGEEQGLGYAYMMMLAIKLVLVAFVMGCAALLRRQLKQPPMSDIDYDNGVSLEYFLALLLMSAVALLTQLPSGPAN
ncbi:CopD family protein [Methylobacillus sp.]|uniref:CopD family protein n=1 Tax=Methylobacillus sp. TaxID=56818 RepID=UPI002FE3CCFE